MGVKYDHSRVATWEYIRVLTYKCVFMALFRCRELIYCDSAGNETSGVCGILSCYLLTLFGLFTL